ncbi:chromatin accessibility complex 16kD protein [Anthonomus grandis grandis]|uniref:chromatin accessibility complex 16kD protein n=1 Tax=Anthonomus grandis grandis TaxID=2921223 RepID=UPI00216616D0|nr:chromatin accessibility complex 16kD protein [Anthonomus grandis grandis]
MEPESDKLSHRSAISVGRVNTIMKSSSDVENVSKESSLVMSKAVELFIKMLTEEGFGEVQQTNKKLEYKCLSNVVHREDKYKFLRDILPKKITVLQYKEIVAKRNREEKKEGEKGSSTEDSDGSSSSGNSDGEVDSNDSGGSVK